MRWILILLVLCAFSPAGPVATSVARSVVLSSPVFADSSGTVQQVTTSNTSLAYTVSSTFTAQATYYDGLTSNAEVMYNSSYSGQDNCWASDSGNNAQWLQADFGEVLEVTEVNDACVPSTEPGGWGSAYNNHNVQYSRDGTTWFPIIDMPLHSQGGTWTNACGVTNTFAFDSLGGATQPQTVYARYMRLGPSPNSNWVAACEFWFKAVIGGRAVPADNDCTDSLDTCVANTGLVMQIDSHQPTSAANSNMTNIATPADGESANAYNLAAQGGVTFLSANMYWNPTGSTHYFQSSGGTTFTNSWHKTTGGGDFWALVVVKGDGATVKCNFLSTTNGFNEAPDPPQGLALGVTAGERFQFVQNGDSAQYSTFLGDAGAYTAGRHLLAIAHDASAGTLRWWHNSATSADIATSFDTTTTDAQPLTIGSNADNDDEYCGADAKIYTVMTGNTFPDDAQMAQHIAYIEGLHNWDYTP